jgi:hypothetical protein
LRHHRLADKGLGNIYRELEEASKFANLLYPDCEIDQRFLEVFVEFVPKKAHKHIDETFGTKIKSGNAKATFVDENKLRNRTLNTIKLSNGEEIVTEDFEEINRNVIRSEINIITLRNMLVLYQVLFRTIADPKNIYNAKYQEIMQNDDNVGRFRAELISYIREAFIILGQNNIQSQIIKMIRENIINYVDRFYFDVSKEIREDDML